MSATEGRAADPSADRHTVVFEAHRRTLFRAAYQVLGTVQDSEDAVQETWLRWTGVDLAEVRDARSYLLRAVTRTALNTLRSRARRREEYVGPWLPEPASTDHVEPGHLAEAAEDVSLALLVVLEALSPAERVAFVLRVVFELPYAEVAQTLDRSEVAARQLVARARAHVRADAPRHPVDADTHRALTTTFLAAAQGATPIEDIVSVLAPDVVLTTDAGGRAKAALRPIVGVDKVVRFVAGILQAPEVAAMAWSLGEVNGTPALLGGAGSTVDAVVWIDVDEGLVTRVNLVRNPDKLAAVRMTG